MWTIRNKKKMIIPNLSWTITEKQGCRSTCPFSLVAYLDSERSDEVIDSTTICVIFKVKVFFIHSLNVYTIEVPVRTLRYHVRTHSYTKNFVPLALYWKKCSIKSKLKFLEPKNSYTILSLNRKFRSSIKVFVCKINDLILMQLEKIFRLFE